MVESESKDQQSISREGKRALTAIVILAVIVGAMLLWMTFVAPGALKRTLHLKMEEGEPGAVVSQLEGLEKSGQLDADLQAIYASAVAYQSALDQARLGKYEAALFEIESVDDEFKEMQKLNALHQRLVVLSRADRIYNIEREFRPRSPEDGPPKPFDEEVVSLFKDAGKTLADDFTEREATVFRELHRMLIERAPEVARGTEYKGTWPSFFAEPRGEAK